MDLTKNALIKLQENPKETFVEASRLLVKIADNILKEPTNLKIRTLLTSNATVSNKILSIKGGLDCLKIMGFQENNLKLILPPNASLVQLEKVRNEIVKYQETSCDSGLGKNMFAGLMQNEDESTESSSDSDDKNKLNVKTSRGAIPKNSAKNTIVDIRTSIPHNVQTVKLPPLVYTFNNPFLRSIESSFHAALAYADKDLLEKARKVIPIIKLEIAAQNRLRSLQEQIKKVHFEDPNVSLQEMLLLELLSWFNNDYFSWIDSPDCIDCGGSTVFSHMSQDSTLRIHTDRVEMHKCQKCQQVSPFPRYNDVNLLLITRRGRCGEWANTFTLFCCAVGWDARLVVDQGDHVWTEVYSFTQKRWLHCDPCENACDTPLVYENGWGKQLSYVIAYSSEEVQDVTWRYSSQHKVVLTRRTSCSETELIEALMKLREQRQKAISGARKEYLTKRLLAELTEFLNEKKPNEADQKGRSSGSLAWRLTRGEIQQSSSYCWNINECVDSCFTMRYSAALDRYEIMLKDGTMNSSLKEWHTGTFEIKDVFRKEEKDWKMVYLSRREGFDKGQVSWKFAVNIPDKTLDKVEINLEYKLYNTGKVSITVEGDCASIDFPENTSRLTTNALAGSMSITITASLSGGQGDVAWQHAQLFRQSTASTDYPFSVTFTFK